MSGDTPTLARRAVACAGFYWCDGMRDTMGRRVVNGGGEPEDGEQFVQWTQRHGLSDYEGVGDAEPDLDDPATLGCLLALVREAWGDPRAYVRRLDSGTWAVMPSDGSAGFYGTGDTEAEALVAALEAAPQPGTVTT